MIGLVDTHQHLILRDLFAYDWADAIPALAGRSFRLDDFTNAAAPTAAAPITATVFMEAGVNDAFYKAEARHVAGLIHAGRIAAQVASCRPEQPDLSDWLDECADLGVVGFRRILHVVPDAVSEQPQFRAGLREIGHRGFSFDLCLRADQHGIGIDLLQACPEVQFILNHCGNPDIAADAYAGWSASMAQLAEFPNLAVKLSGITVNARPDQQTLDALRPYMDRVVSLFGPDRIVWGSDWPVCNLGMGPAQWIATTQAYLQTLSTAEAVAIASGNAQRLYRLTTH